MSILFVNMEIFGDCPIWSPENEEFFPMKMMEEKVFPKEI
jgi:hypothetical protein